MHPRSVILAIIFLTALSCSKDVSSCGQQGSGSLAHSQQPIVFGSNGELTRSFVRTTEQSLLDYGFTVAGIMSTGETLFKDEAEWDSSGMCFRTVHMNYFFPSDESVSLDFHAIHPTEGNLAISGGKAFLKYILDPDDDIVAASRLGVGVTSDPVNLVFDHILSRVSFTLSAEESGVRYEVMKVSISAPGNGCFSFETGNWSAGAELFNAVISDEPVEPSEAKTPVGSTLSVLPLPFNVQVWWKTFREGILVSEYSRSISISPTMGKYCIINLHLPDDEASQIDFSTEVTPWGQTYTDINLN